MVFFPHWDLVSFLSESHCFQDNENAKKKMASPSNEKLFCRNDFTLQLYNSTVYVNRKVEVKINEEAILFKTQKNEAFLSHFQHYLILVE